VDPASRFFSPKQGWRRAAYAPEKSTVMPSNVELAGLAVANGFGFVDAATHMTLYAAPVSHPLPQDWHPVRASALAHPLGEFSIVTRSERTDVPGNRELSTAAAAAPTPIPIAFPLLEPYPPLPEVNDPLEPEPPEPPPPY